MIVGRQVGPGIGIVEPQTDSMRAAPPTTSMDPGYGIGRINVPNYAPGMAQPQPNNGPPQAANQANTAGGNYSQNLGGASGSTSNPSLAVAGAAGPTNGIGYGR